jgi:hypothetical protein
MIGSVVRIGVVRSATRRGHRRPHASGRCERESRCRDAGHERGASTDPRVAPGRRSGDASDREGLARRRRHRRSRDVLDRRRAGAVRTPRGEGGRRIERVDAVRRAVLEPGWTRAIPERWRTHRLRRRAGSIRRRPRRPRRRGRSARRQRGRTHRLDARVRSTARHGSDARRGQGRSALAPRGRSHERRGASLRARDRRHGW